jgi:hypothetical protein
MLAQAVLALVDRSCGTVLDSLERSSEQPLAWLERSGVGRELAVEPVKQQPASSECLRGVLASKRSEEPEVLANVSKRLPFLECGSNFSLAERLVRLRRFARYAIAELRKRHGL